MIEKNLQLIEEFFSYSDFLKLKDWVEESMKLGTASEVPVQDYFAGPNFTERWFRFEGSQDIWRLVYPDSPFKGYWGRVD